MGDTLISVLRQLRSGYAERPQSFPQSIILLTLETVIDEGLKQTSAYVDKTGAKEAYGKRKFLLKQENTTVWRLPFSGCEQNLSGNRIQHPHGELLREGFLFLLSFQRFEEVYRNRSLIKTECANTSVPIDLCSQT